VRITSQHIFINTKTGMTRHCKIDHGSFLLETSDFQFILTVTCYLPLRGLQENELSRQLNNQLLGLNAYKILVGKSEGRDHSEDLGIQGKIILKWILGK